MICGLLGRTLGHSFSPAIHRMLGDYEYRLFEKEPEQVEDFLKYGDFSGLNVTVPYKQAVIPFLQALSPTAQALGAVNTVVRTPDGTLWGHNTDLDGFLYMLQKISLCPRGKKALVLGTGGAGRVCAKALEDLGARVITVSRRGKNNYDNLSLHRDAAILVNATPVGMYPNMDASPVDLDIFPALEAVLDVIYNPAKTELLLQAEARNIPALNGLWMLISQAVAASACFTGLPAQTDRIPAIGKAIRSQAENTVLIGMPGCGKTTVGRCLSARTGKPFLDLDAEIEAAAGISVPAFLQTYGETAFRHLETKVLRHLSGRTGVILACGGGVVTRDENKSLLRRNGTVVCLHRPLEALATEGRPLSRDLASLSAVRKPMYEAFADVFVDNTAAPEDTCRDIIRKLEEKI